MSPCYSDGSLAICTGSNVRYQARTHWLGYRKWNLVGKPTRSYEVAVRRMTGAFIKDRLANRADVVMTADYYDPVQLCELVRR